MDKCKKYKGQNEQGITLIALIVTIVILVIISGITIKALTGKSGLIDVTTTAARESKIAAYDEQIEQTVFTEIISKSTIGEEATTISIAERLSKEDWIASSTVSQTATSAEGNITVIVKKEGFIFQVYYNALLGKVATDYIGKAEGNGGSSGSDFGDISNKLPLIYAEYNGSTSSIEVITRMPGGISNGIKSITIYEDGDDSAKAGEKVDGIIDDETYTFPIEKSGLYKVVVVSKDGVSNLTFVYASISENGLLSPIIKVVAAESGVANGEWYGKDKLPVVVEIDTSNSKATVTGIHYEIISTPVNESTGEAEIQRQENDVADTKFKLPGITTAGTTKIIAYAKGKTEGSTSEPSVLEVRYDSTAPILNKINLVGNKKEGFDWFNSDVQVCIQKNDLVERNSRVSEYWYKMDGSTPVQEKDINKTQTVSKEGTTKFEIKVVDKAGNESAWVPVDVNKDTQKPDKPTLSLAGNTSSSIEVEARGNDNESDIYSYKFEIRPLLGSNSDWHSPTDATIVTTAGAQKYNFTNKEKGEYKIRVTVVDLAGNENMSDAKDVETVMNSEPVFTKQATASDITRSSMNIRASATDADENATLTYTLYWGTSEDNLSEVTSNTNTPCTFPVSGLKPGTKYYFRVDVSNDYVTTPGTVKNATTVANNAPQFTKQAVASDITSKSMTISATATDSDSDTITYNFYWGTSSGSLSKVTSNTTGSFSRTGLTASTTYYFRIDATDGYTTTTGTRNSATTARPNASGVIEDIVTADFTLPSKSILIKTNMGKSVDYTFKEEKITIPKDLSGYSSDQFLTIKNTGESWVVLGETEYDIYILRKVHRRV